jgi:hypothetical protein
MNLRTEPMLHGNRGGANCGIWLDDHTTMFFLSMNVCLFPLWYMMLFFLFFHHVALLAWPACSAPGGRGIQLWGIFQRIYHPTFRHVGNFHRGQREKSEEPTKTVGVDAPWWFCLHLSFCGFQESHIHFCCEHLLFIPAHVVLVSSSWLNHGLETPNFMVCTP